MGLGLAAVQNTLELWQQGLLNTANKVVEMGVLLEFVDGQ